MGEKLCLICVKVHIKFVVQSYVCDRATIDGKKQWPQLRSLRLSIMEKCRYRPICGEKSVELHSSTTNSYSWQARLSSSVETYFLGYLHTKE